MLNNYFSPNKNEEIFEKDEGQEEIILSINLYFGVGMEANPKEAKRWCLLSSEKGNLLAQGVASFFGWKTQKSFDMASHYFKELLRRDVKMERIDSSYACNMLGFMHKNGNGVKKNYLKAIEYYKMASSKGNTLAMNNLAFMYEEGIGKKKKLKFILTEIYYNSNSFHFIHFDRSRKGY